MRRTARGRFVGLLAGTALVLTARIAGFAPPPTPGEGHQSWAPPGPLSLPSADFNADGRPDVAPVVRTGGGAIRIVAAGCGRIDLPLREPLAGVTVDDYDNDGDPDIVGLGVGGWLFIWENQGGCRLRALSPQAGQGSPSWPGPSLGPTLSAGDPLRSVETRRPVPTARRVLRFLADVRPLLLRSPRRTFDAPRPIATDPEFSRPPPPSRLAAS